MQIERIRSLLNMIPLLDKEEVGIAVAQIHKLLVDAPDEPGEIVVDHQDIKKMFELVNKKITKQTHPLQIRYLEHMNEHLKLRKYLTKNEFKKLKEMYIFYTK